MWEFDYSHTSDDILPTNDQEDFISAVSSFVEFIWSCPETAATFSDLLHLLNKIQDSPDIQDILQEQRETIRRLVKRISSQIEITTENGGSYKQFLDAWLAEEPPPTRTLEDLERAFDILREFVGFVRGESSVDLDLDSGENRPDPELDKMAREQIRARVKTRLHYRAADSAAVLNTIYEKVNVFGSPLIPEEHRTRNEDVQVLWFMMRFEKVSGGEYCQVDMSGTREHCRKVYHSLLNSLDTAVVKARVLSRLKVYFEWFRREELRRGISADRKRKAKGANKKTEIESILQECVEEFVFSSGYFPIAQFRLGRSKPDLLVTAPGEIPLLLELKQILAKNLIQSDLRKAVSQTMQYAELVRTQGGHESDEVYLVVFYDEDILPQIVSQDVEELGKSRIYVSFIYLGTSTPSKLKRSKIFTVLTKVESSK